MSNINYHLLADILPDPTYKAKQDKRIKEHRDRHMTIQGR